MYDLTNKLVDCSELTDMVGGEQVFNMIKTMCNGKTTEEFAKFNSIGTWRFLRVNEKGYYSLTNDVEHLKFSTIIKPVDVVGEARMNAAKDGATLITNDERPNVNVSETVFYWSNGYVQTPDGVARPSTRDVKLIGYKSINSYSTGYIKTIGSPSLDTSFVNRDHLVLDHSKILAEKVGVNVKNVKHFSTALKGEELRKLSSISAEDIIKAGLGHISDRAVTYDKPEGERSMAATVAAFNAVTNGIMDTEEKGWLFIVLLKIVRSQQGDFKLDNYEDGSAYFGLMGEAASKERGVK